MTDEQIQQQSESLQRVSDSLDTKNRQFLIDAGIIKNTSRKWTVGKLVVAKESMQMELKNNRNWRLQYDKAKRFYLKHGDLWIDPKQRDLYQWLQRQRKEYNKGDLTFVRVALLKDIGIEWENNLSPRWMFRLKELEKFVERELSEPTRASNNPLFAWLTIQKSRYKKGELNRKQIGLLKKVVKMKKYG